MFEPRRRPMPAVGQTLANPITGESITFRNLSRGDASVPVELDFLVAPGGAPPAAHVHPRQVETFTVHSGRCRIVIDGVEREAGAGDVVAVPPGAAHTWAALTETRMTVRLEPGLRADEFFEDLFMLAQTGGVNRKGLPTP